jgi:hypothetical protein
MSIALPESAHIILDRIVTLAKHDVDFRLALADVLESLSASAVVVDEIPGDEATTPVEAMLGPPEEPAQPLVIDDAPYGPELPPANQIRPRQPREPIQTDLGSIEVRCHLKAEGARWAAERQRRVRNGTPFSTAVAPYDRDLLGRASELGCYLWMNGPNQPIPTDIGLLDVLGSCFDVAADAAALLRECAFEVEDDDLLKRCLDVAAEAQSALRSAVMAVEATTDTDQQSLFLWIRNTVEEERVFIDRHLRATDPADPYSSADIQGRIQTIREECQAAIERQVQRTRWLSRLQYHAKLIRERGSNDHDWSIVAQVTDEMVRDGIPPSNREIRDVMLPIIDNVPRSDAFPPAFVLVVREAEAYRATRNLQRPDRTDMEPSADVLAVRRFLEGTTVVIIGGDSRDHAQQALKEAFGLEDVVWVDSKEHQSTDTFRPYVQRPNVRLVVLLIRWASHSYGGLKRFCTRHGKLFVRLPGGYNPNQLASQILAQCGYLLTQEAAVSDDRSGQA